MKKVIVLFAAATFIISCGNDSNKSADNTGTTSGTEATTADSSTGAATTPETTAPGATASSADADKGLDLIAKSDCLTCHKVEEKLVGPAYRDIAKKYENTSANVDSLASKVIHGGAGNWGQVPMTPHPALSKEDAQLMVKYVLSLK